MQNVVEMTYEFVDNGITKDVVGHDAGRFTPFLGTLFLFILFLNIWEVIPGIQFPPTSRMGIPGFLAIQIYVIYLVRRVSSTRGSSTSPGTCSRRACRRPSTSS